MRSRLALLCLAVLAIPALADLAEARSCGAKSRHLAWAGLDEPRPAARVSGGLRFTVGATYPL